MKGLFGVLSPAGRRARLTTLIFHRVTPDVDPMFPGELDAKRFDALCGWLRSWFNVLPASDAIDGLRSGRLPSRAACITFDDGYADNHDVAMPILRRHGLTATFFVSTGFLDGGRMWNDTLVEAVRRSPKPELDLRGLPGMDLGLLPLHDLPSKKLAVPRILMSLKYLPPTQRASGVEWIARASGAKLPDDLMMTSDQVRALHRSGMTIGAHTVSHPILASLDDDVAQRELQQSREDLAGLTSSPVTLFAYPNGKPGEDFGARDVALARKLGFDAAFTTAAGVARPGSDVFQLPRFTPWRRTRWSFALQLARNMAS